MKTYVLLTFHIQININYNKSIIAAALLISQFTPLYVTPKLENVPAQILTLLPHWRTNYKSNDWNF